MATRPKKSELLLLATRLANHDLVSEEAPSGRAYKAFMIRAEIEALHHIADLLGPPVPVSGIGFSDGAKVAVAK